MKSELGYFISFAVGAVLGAGAAWFTAKQKYEALANEEIEQVREAYKRAEEETDGEEDKADREEVAKPQTSSKPSYLAHEGFKKPDITSYRKIVKDEGYLPQGQTEPSEENWKTEVISPDEFGLDADYEKITLTLTANGYLLDEDMEPVVDEHDLTGMGTNEIREHFGEFEEDTVFVVNHDRRAYYEILDSLREYEE